MLFALKLVLAPVLVASVSLVGRVLGPRTAGFLGALPIIAGPAVWLMTREQGARFGAQAALACALGCAGTTLFAWTFARSAPHARWWGCMTMGYGGFAVGTLVLSLVPTSLATAALLPAATHAAFLRGVRAPEGASLPRRPPAWDLPLRMLLTAALVFGITSAASALGPRMSGLLTPFPVATSVLASFAHAQEGAAASILLLRGLVLGLYTFTAFFVVLAVALAEGAESSAFLVAAMIALVLHAGLAWLTRGRK